MLNVYEFLPYNDRSVVMTKMLQSDYISVSDLIKSFNSVLSSKFSKVYFQGEISSCKVYSSGHAYMDIKDQDSVVNAVMWRGNLSRLGFKPEAGKHVLCTGAASVYAPRGSLQVILSSMKLAGEGDLQQKFLELKAKLEKEGLFAPERKRPLPFLPETIGLVTSESGAVVHDMSVKFQERMPSVKLYLYDARVQGAGASKEIVKGVKYFNQKKVDLIIIARGGGSLEDLWPFNEEELVRAVFASNVPVISGVGHEPDITLSDLAADLRAPTPTAAAEMAVPKISDLHDEIEDLSERLLDREEWFSYYQQALDYAYETYLRSFQSFISVKKSRVEVAEKLLRLIEPKNLIAKSQDRIQQSSSRLNKAYSVKLKQNQLRLHGLKQTLETLNPSSVLTRGYSLVRVGKKIVRSYQDLKKDDQIKIQFAKGSAEAAVKGTNKE